jgi:hypothetical protein
MIYMFMRENLGKYSHDKEVVSLLYEKPFDYW